MDETYPAYVGLATTIMMMVLFVAIPWFAHKVISRPRPTLLPPSAPSCATLVVVVALLRHLVQQETDPKLAETWGSLGLLFAIILLFTVCVTPSWIRPLRNQPFRPKTTFIVGRVAFISLSVAVVARSVQLHPVGLSSAWRGGWNVFELVTWLIGWAGAISLVVLVAVAGVTHYRARKEAAAAEG